MQINTIIQGDTLTELKKLPAESVDMIVTSPPFYCLRDYGTGIWKGGDPKCDHIMPRNVNRCRPGDKEDLAKGQTGRNVWTTCGKCGARKVDQQIGLETTPEEYVEKLVIIFHEAKRVLKKTGTLWLNLGDTYSAQRWSNNKGTGFMRTGKNSLKCEVQEKQSGLPDKNLIGIPWRVAFALQATGWILRQDIIWHKPNPMPESVKDRCTKAHEYIFLLSKNQNYYFDSEAIRENWTDTNIHDTKRAGKFIRYQGKWKDDKGNRGVVVGNPSLGRNKRDVWRVNCKPFKEAHFAVFPEELIAPMILAGCPKDGVVLDIFMGSGTTGVVAKKLKRNYLGIELNPKYITMANQRIKSTPTPLL